MAVVAREEQLNVALSFASQANREHEAIAAKQKGIVGHALRGGKSLLAAQAKVPRGLWGEWMRAHLSMHPTTAYNYMRLARHADQVRAAGAPSIEAALALLADPERLRPSQHAQAFQAAHARGDTIEDIAARHGVSTSAVWYWVSEKNEDRRGDARRKSTARARLAAVQQQRAVKARKLSGPVAAAYSHLRRAEQALDQAIADEHRTPEERAMLRRALGGCYPVEDDIVRALGIEEPAPPSRQSSEPSNVRRLHRRRAGAA